MSRPPAMVASVMLHNQAAAAAPAWFWPLILTLFGGAVLAVQLIDLRHANGPLEGLQAPLAASQAVQEAP